MINKNIVLIADRVSTHENGDIHCTSFEKLSDNYFNDLFNGLKSFSNKVFHYENPEELLNNITKHKNDFVVTVWSGEKSRNRKSLIPSICEAYNIMYLGADTYVHTISQDKNLSKIFCEDSGILTPNSKLIFNADSLDVIYSLNLPLVVKPNFEGGSIGISKRNLVNNYEDAKKLTKELLGLFNQPILVEEFIEGDEINFIIAGYQNKIFLEAMKLHSDDIDIKKHICSYELKKLKGIETKSTLFTSFIDDSLLEKIKKLYNKLEKVDIMRVDGRMKDNQFYCIELSPDMSLSPRASVYEAFSEKEFEYEETLKKLVSLSIESYLYRSANMK